MFWYFPWYLLWCYLLKNILVFGPNLDDNLNHTLKSSITQESVFLKGTPGDSGARFRITLWKALAWGFPGGAVVKNPPANAGDKGLSPGPGRSHMPWSN